MTETDTPHHMPDVGKMVAAATAQPGEREELTAELRSSFDTMIALNLSGCATAVERAIETLATLTRELVEAQAEVGRKDEALRQIQGWTMHSGVHRYQQGEHEPRGYYAHAFGLAESEISAAREIAAAALPPAQEGDHG